MSSAFPVSTPPREPPTVSILVPCLNEGGTITGLLDAIRHQTYPLEKLEVVVADGGSTDGTLEKISAFQTAYSLPRVVLVHNPRSNIPTALNLAIASATGDILIRLDGHSKPDPEYVRHCIDLLEAGKGDMVGGGLEVFPRNRSWQAISIAAAVSHPFGVGDAHFRYSADAREVDTIAFCAFRRFWIEKIGGYDETLLTNEDYEFNSRLRRNGGRIWLDPSVRTVYYPPATLGGLWRQYTRYGLWKGIMLRRNLSTIRWRHLAPPLAVWGGALLVVFAPFSLGASRALLLLALIYAMMALLVSTRLAVRNRSLSVLWGAPLAFLVAHLTWGSSILKGLVFGNRLKQSRP